ncbi:MAG: 3-dehydroquinate synthase [Planctomycetes bacterium]|nr:3-dehydroquinate synthase [Planctomycetota bacterium]MCC7172188.1 3-dehydroquinate synthase [Planctomycetota bacterium]
MRIRSSRGATDVLVERGALDALGTALPARIPGFSSTPVLVHDAASPKGLVARALRGLERDGLEPSAVALDLRGGKTLAQAEALCHALLERDCDRTAVLIALGGGAVSDLTGFVAAIYLRGVRYVNVPTTLLAQIDASIGGKTGVDLPEGKNLVGAFWPPTVVVVDPDVLTGLPATEWSSGFGEVAKYAVLAEDLLALLEATTSSPTNDPALLDQILAMCVRTKVRYVEADEFDRGVRRALNLGHTIGHALEAATGFALLRHGEAVALGLRAEAHLSRALGFASSEFEQRVVRLLRRLGLRTTIPALDVDRVLAFARHDKKREGDAIRFALPVAPGETRMVDVAELGRIADAVRSLFESA